MKTIFHRKHSASYRSDCEVCMGLMFDDLVTRSREEINSSCRAQCRDAEYATEAVRALFEDTYTGIGSDYEPNVTGVLGPQGHFESIMQIEAVESLVYDEPVWNYPHIHRLQPAYVHKNRLGFVEHADKIKANPVEGDPSKCTSALDAYQELADEAILMLRKLISGPDVKLLYYKEKLKDLCENELLKQELINDRGGKVDLGRVKFLQERMDAVTDIKQVTMFISNDMANFQTQSRDEVWFTESEELTLIPEEFLPATQPEDLEYIKLPADWTDELIETIDITYTTDGPGLKATVQAASLLLK